MNHLKHKAFIILGIFFALSIYGTFILINETNDLKLDSSEGIFDASKLYFGWLNNVFKNFKTLTTNAIKMDWTSVNESFAKGIENKIDRTFK